MNFTSVKKIHKTKVALNYEKIKRNLGHGRLLDKKKTIGGYNFYTQPTGIGLKRY